MTSDYVIREIKLCSEVLNDEYIILSNFGGRRMSAFEVIEGGFEDPPVAGSKKKGLTRVKRHRCIHCPYIQLS